MEEEKIVLYFKQVGTFKGDNILKVASGKQKLQRMLKEGCDTLSPDDYVMLDGTKGKYVKINLLDLE